MTFRKQAIFYLLLLFLLVFHAPSWAYWVWSPEAGKFINSEKETQESADEQYHDAMQYYKEKNVDTAAELFEDLLKKYPNAKVAAEAQYRLGMIYEEKADYLKAFQAYKHLLKSYPSTERLNEILEREYNIGNIFLSGKKAKFMGLEILPSLPRAAEVFKTIVEQAPYSEYGEKSQYQLGLAYKKWGHYDDAMDAFESLIEQYPQSELIQDARFQLAETSFLRSSAEYRDQRALDEAARQVEQYLHQYPANEAISEEAAELRQKIDEKNAEKNYRIGLYYEKENYLESALIYYSDVAKRYPGTVWGQKAIGKMNAIEQPASYVLSEREKLDQSIAAVEEKLKAVPDGDALERDQYERQLERLKEKQKSLEKNKDESIKRRKADIKRRETELKLKYKKLQQKKKKMLKENQSQDLSRAFDRWEASLEAEKASLQEEKEQLKHWRERLGMDQEQLFSLEFLPFMGEGPTELEEVRGIDAKKYYKLANQKRDLLNEKELLYKQHGEIVVSIETMQTKRLGLEDDATLFANVDQYGDENMKALQQQLADTVQEITVIETELEEKRKVYEKQYGKANWLSWTKVPTQVLTQSLTRSVDLLNPFDSKADSFGDEDLQRLNERRMHLKEQIAAQRNLIESLSEAFNVELAVQEQQQLMKMLDEQEEVDPRKLRKMTKKLEKNIRADYQEIQARHEENKRLLKELEVVLNGPAPSPAVATARAVSYPAVGFWKLTKAFFVGLPNKDEELTQSAANLKTNDTDRAARAQELKEQIETQSLMIEAKRIELIRLQKELEIMRAKASLAGGYKFRSSFVSVPYEFIREAIASSHRIIPKKNREEMLIQLLDKETKEEARLNQELVEVDAAIEQKTEEAKPKIQEPKKTDEQESESADQQKAAAAAAAKREAEESKQAQLKAEIQILLKRLDLSRKTYDQQKTLLKTQWLALKARLSGDQKDQVWNDEDKQLLKQEKKLFDELKEIEDSIAELIEKENKIEQKEAEILEKRVKEINDMMPKIHSQALAQDLTTERERMLERISQLETRRDFLSTELARFQMNEPSAAKP